MQTFSVQTVVEVEAHSLADAVALVQVAITDKNNELRHSTKPSNASSMEMVDAFVKKVKK